MIGFTSHHAHIRNGEKHGPFKAE